MQTSTKTSTWLFLITFALVFYGMGAAFVEGFVNYPTWPLIGADEFGAYHTALGRLIVVYLALPMLVTNVLTLLLVWLRPAAVPRWAILLAATLQLVATISTIAVQIPIQMELNRAGPSPELIERLIVTNWWMRRAPNLLNALLFLWMMSLMLRRPAEGGARP